MKKSNAGWALLILLSLSVLVNYMDRGNLSVAAPQISKELMIDKAQLGWLLSAFFWTYALCHIVSGWVVDRYNVSIAYAIGYFLWSAATCAIGFVNTFAALFALRLVLGMSESVAFPAYGKLMATGVPEEQRGLANSVLDSSTKFGPALGMLVGGWMVASYGWRAFFIVTGAITLLWLIPWFIYMPPNPGRSLRGGPGYLRIMGRREAWASFLGLFCHNYNWYLLLTWLPSYLVDERKFSLKTMAIYSTLPMVATALATLAAGAYADRLIRAGAAAARTRRNVMIAGMLIAACCLPAATVQNHVVAMTMLTVAFLGVGIYASNCWALAQCLAGPQSAGRWTGLQNCIGNLGGVVAPIVTGYLVQQTKLYWTAFVTSSTVLVIGVLILFFFLRNPSPVEWERA